MELKFTPSIPAGSIKLHWLLNLLHFIREKLFSILAGGERHENTHTNRANEATEAQKKANNLYKGISSSGREL